MLSGGSFAVVNEATTSSSDEIERIMSPFVKSKAMDSCSAAPDTESQRYVAVASPGGDGQKSHLSITKGRAASFAS